jgi:hypothetical protein
MPTKKIFHLHFFLLLNNLGATTSISVNYTAGKIPALINISYVINPSLLLVTSSPIQRSMTLEDLTSAAQGRHLSSAKSYSSQHGSYHKGYGDKKYGHGSKHHGSHNYNNHHGSDGYYNDDKRKQGGQHEDYSKSKRGKYWDEYGEKERVVKDKGSAFIKAFTWDREERKRDKWGSKGGLNDQEYTGSKGKEYDHKISKNKGYHNSGNVDSNGIWRARNFHDGLSGYATIPGDQGFTLEELQNLQFYE